MPASAPRYAMPNLVKGDRVGQEAADWADPNVPRHPGAALSDVSLGEPTDIHPVPKGQSGNVLSQSFGS